MKPVLQLIPGYNVNKKSKSESKRNSCSSVKDLIHLGKQLNSKENNVLSEDIYVNRDMIQAKNIDVDLKPPLPDDVTISEKTTERISPQVPEDGAEKEELYLSLINIEDDVAGFQKQICNRWKQIKEDFPVNMLIRKIYIIGQLWLVQNLRWTDWTISLM